MQQIAGYGRYSDSAQKETSIDDQIREIKKLAQREGLTIPDDMIFADYAVKGTSTVGRAGFRKLMDAWDAGLLDILFVDEMSRLARDLATGGELIAKVEKTGVIIISGDGLDTRRKDWQMSWSFKLVQASQEVRNIAPRVRRGMEGQLDRGFMIACPPVGYTKAKVVNKKTKQSGTGWFIDDTSAAIVREIFYMRFSGASLGSIALALNERRIIPPRLTRDGKAGYWRPASISRVLSNTIYRGIFQWNGSAFSRAKAQRERRALEVTEYPFPELRLVDDAVWYACNPTDRKRRINGGGKHVFSGLVRCGNCDGYLSVGGGPVHFSLYCAECEQAKRVGRLTAWMGYTSLSAAQQALYHALELLFTGDIIEEFRSRLRARLTEGPIAELVQLKEEIQQLKAASDRAQRLLSMPDIDETLFVGEARRISEDHRRTTVKLEQLEKQNVKVTPEVIEQQCLVEPLRLLAEMLNSERSAENYKIRATLKRLLHRFAFVARPAKNVSVFEISFIPGALTAELTNTVQVENEQVTFVVTSRTSAKRPVVWEVEVKRK